MDTAAGFTRSWSVTKNGSPFGSGGAGTGFSFTPDDNGTYVVTFSATDKDGGTGSDSKTITVTNVAPNVSAPSGQSSVEGSSGTFTLGSFGDSGANDNPWTADVNWGDGTTHSTFTKTAVGSLGSQPHTYDDSGSYTVTVTVTDKDSGSGTATFQVTVGNVAPEATLSNNGPVDEGSPATVSFTSPHDPSGTDTSAGFHYAFSCSNGDLSGATYAGSGASASTTCTFPDNGTKTVKARILDKDGGSTEYTTSVVVKNVAPSVTPGSGSATEGATGSFSLGSLSDPGAGDAPWKVHVDWGDGTSSDLPDFATQGSLGLAPHKYVDDGTFTVKVTVTDKDGDSGDASFAVNVLNAAPIVTQPAGQAADEGAAKSFALGSFTDSGAEDNPWSIDVDWGDGGSDSFSQNTQGTIAAASHTFDDGPHTYTVSVTVRDKDGGSDTKSFEVMVANIAPTATLSNSGPTNEGSDATISLSSQHDPSNADTSSGFHYTYACDGNAASLAGTYAAAAMGPSATCSFPDGPASHPVLARIFDKDNGYHEYSTAVVVTNAAPDATAPADQPAYEGMATSFDLGSFSDAGVNDNPWSVYLQWGDGHTDSYSQGSQGSITAESHTYADNGTYAVNVNVMDKDGGSDSASFEITVANVPPLVVGPADQASSEGENKSFDLGSFSDVGVNDAPWHVSVDWGDGNASTLAAVSAQGALGNAAHSYADNGSYTAKVTVTDKDGGSNEAAFHVTVANLPPQLGTAGDQTAVEGTSTAFSLGSFSDPGVNDKPWAVDVNWGDGSAHTTFSASSQGSLGSQSHTYADDSAHTVTVTVTDKDGASDSDSFGVTVNNANPSVAAAAAQSSDEGESHSFALGSFTDAGVNDNPWSIDVDWGDGTSHTTFTTSSQGSLGSSSHMYTDNGSFSVTVKVTDKDGGNASAAFNVTVGNVSPSVTAAADQTADEGTERSFSLGSFTDPGADSPWSVDVDWGDGSAHTAFTAGAAGPVPAKAHTYADNGSYTVTVKVTDDTASGQASFKVTVANVPPTVTSFTGSNVLAGGLVFGLSGSFSGSFTDPGVVDNPWTVSFTWDGVADATSLTIGANVPKTFTIRPQFTTGGCNKTASVKVTDKDGGVGTRSTTVQVGTGEFMPPMTNQPVTDKLKNGQVLPVKVRIADCNGNPITGLTPGITLKKGDLTDGVVDDSLVTMTPESVSSADTTGVMRYADGYYIYNMRVSVPNGDLGVTPYTVMITPGIAGYIGTMQLRHKVLATK